MRWSRLSAFSVSRHLLLPAVALLALAGCGRRGSNVDAGLASQTLHVAIGAEPRDLDPHLLVSFNDMNVALALFEGLTAIDERTSQPVPAAAERWTTSPDGLTWTFHLREGLRWSDGTPLTADDFVYSFRRALSPALAAEYAYVLYPIVGAEAFNTGTVTDATTVGVEAPDPRTVVLRLHAPSPMLPAVLALTVAFPVPGHVIEPRQTRDGRAARWTDAGNLVGNGPFRLAEWSPNRRVVVTHNDHFRAAATTRLRSIIFYPYENAVAQEAAFRTGQLHLTSDVPLSKIAPYQRESPGLIRLDPFLSTGFIRFNTTRPPFDDPRVRAALARAIDRPALARVLGGGQTPAHRLTPPDTAGYTATATLPDDFDAARALLAEAGFPGGRGFPRAELMFLSSEMHQRLLEAVQQMWRRELGLDVQLAMKDQRVWLDNERQLAYDLSNARWIGDYVDPSTFLELFLGHSGNNATGWSHPRYDELVQRASAEPDEATRHALYQQAEAILLADAPIIPLYHGTQTFLIHPTVRGWEPSLLGFRRYQHVWLEE